MDDPVTPNPYKTLGVPKDAPLATIRSAHRKLVLSCHPDKVQDESAKKVKAEEFHLVQQAYEILSDETRRERYDEKARLAELRAEMAEERGPPRRPEYMSPRSTHSPVFEVRGGRIYEERVPKTTRVYQDDSFAKFESRPSARKYDEMYGDTTARKTSGRGQEDKRRAREPELEFSRKQKETARKQEEAAVRELRERRRAKDRKKDVEAKSKKKFSYVDEPSSDSDTDDRYYASRRGSTPPPRRYEEARRRDTDPPRRTTVRDDRDYDGMDMNISAAKEYMNRSREAVREPDVEPRSRPSRPRASSNLDRAAPPAPAPPPVRPTETRRRSSDRERSDKERSGGEKDRRRGRGSRAPSPIRTTTSAKKEKYEIVDPAPRKPSMPVFSSDPKGLRDFVGSSPRKDGTRTTSYQPAQEFIKPSMRRSETMPINRTRPSTQVPLKSSTLRNAKAPSDISESDSDDATDSDVTPVVKSRASPPRQGSSTKYKVTDKNMVAEPEDMYDRVREDSPRTTRRPERPSMESRPSSMRTPPMRGSSFVVSQDDRPSARRTESTRLPPLSTQGSGRGKKLFGSVEDFSSHDEGYRSPRSPKVSEFESRGSRGHSRRESDDLDLDAYPGSLHKSHRRPSYQRNESVY